MSQGASPLTDPLRHGAHGVGLLVFRGTEMTAALLRNKPLVYCNHCFHLNHFSPAVLLSSPCLRKAKNEPSVYSVSQGVS